MDELDGLRALVTGGASGIGLAIAAALAAEGAGVVVLDLARRAPGHAAVRARLRHGDITDDGAGPHGGRRGASSRSAASTSWSTTPASARRATVEDNADEEWHRVLDVNVVGIAAGVPRGLPALRASAHAAVVNTALDRGDRRAAAAGACTRPARARCSR